MDIESDNLERALRAAMKIISDSYAAAETVNGAYQLTREKIQNFYRGKKSRRSDFVSTEAIAYVVAKSKQKTLEEARAHFGNKSETELDEVRRKLRLKLEHHWDEARKYDRIDHGGRKLVHQNKDGSKIIFVFSDQRKLEFEFNKCSKSIRQWLLSMGTSSEPSDANALPVLIGKIEEITKWPSVLIGQALATLESGEISMLYANHHLSQFRSLLVQEERIIITSMNKITVHDILEVLQSMLDKLNK